MSFNDDFERDADGFPIIEPPPRKRGRQKTEKAHLESPEDDSEVIAYEEANRDAIRKALEDPVKLNEAKGRTRKIVASVMEEGIIYLIGEAKNPKNPSKFRAELWKEILSHGVSKAAPNAPVKIKTKKRTLSLQGMPSIPQPSDNTNAESGEADLSAEPDMGDAEYDEENEETVLE